MIYKVTSPNSEIDFEKYFYFRWKLLRKPLNKKLGTERDSLENSSIHRMLIDDDNNVMAVGRLHYNNNNEAQIRYFAVDHDNRRMGLGSYLMNDLESIAKKTNHTEVILNARENAVIFYKNLGYEVVKESYILFDKIQHFEMKKVL
tara:strand:+ start:4061 stop:4498 length:438 start_codon:yes stop_codon:yes gene_type:complete